MIESILIILLIIAVITMILAMEWESLTMSIIDTVLWLTLAISIFSVEIPYQYTSGGAIHEATQSLEGMYPLAWLFLGISIIMMIHTFILGFEMLKGKKPRLL
jgi:hypothetical protein